MIWLNQVLEHLITLPLKYAWDKATIKERIFEALGALFMKSVNLTDPS